MLLLQSSVRPYARPDRSNPSPGTNPPTVSLLLPLAAATFPQLSATLGPTIQLSASATPDTGRHITKVQFRRNGVVKAEATALSSQNIALQSAGGTISASSFYNQDYTPAKAFNGDRKGQNWQTPGALNGGWISGGNDASPTLTRSFGSVRNVDAINIFFTQDDYRAPIDPTFSTVGTLYQAIDFEIQYKSGVNWVTVPNGSVRNNTFVGRQFTFAQPISTDAIQFVQVRGPDQYARVTEFEVVSSSYLTTFDASEADVPVGAWDIDAKAIQDDAQFTISASHSVTVTAFQPQIEPQPAAGTLRANYTEGQLRAGVVPANLLIKYLSMESRDQMVADGWQNLPDAQQAAVYKFAEFKEFPQYPGVKFVRVPDGGWDFNRVPPGDYRATTVTSWHWLLPTWVKEVWFSYVIMFTPSVSAGFNETGLKLPALGSDYDSQYGADEFFHGFSARTWCHPPNFATNPISYLGSTYEFRADNTIEGDFSHTWSGVFQEEVFHTVDFRVKMNTTNVPGSFDLADWNADGHREIWLDDVRVRYDTDVKWTYSPFGNWIKQIFHNILHGGQTWPNSRIDFWCGPCMLSTVRGGKLAVAGTPIPDPDPSPTPSPDGTHGTTITENSGVVWTRGPAVGTDFQTLRNQVWVGGGLGAQYLYFSAQVYVKSNDNGNWYRWTGTAWVSVGSTDPSQPVVIPPGDPPAGSLAGLPSAPSGAHIALINALGSNQWVNLGPATPDPVFGGRRAASWSPRMCHAPGLGGAFTSGQGLHGFVAPTGRYDDVFFYDLFRHRWLCVEPGIQTDTFKADVQAGRIRLGGPRNDYLVYFGISDHADGTPIYGVGAHAYQWSGYDSDNRIYHPGGWPTGIGGDAHVMATPADNNTHGNDYWFQNCYSDFDLHGWRSLPRSYDYGYSYNVAAGKMNREQGGASFFFPSTSPKPGPWTLYSPNGDPSNGFTYTAWGGSHLANTPESGGSYDFGACQDTVRHRIYMGFMAGATFFGGSMYVYDLATNAWDHPAATTANRVPSANHGLLHYDSHADRVIIFHGFKDYPDAVGITPWNPATKTFGAPLSFPGGFPSLPATTACGFYSPELNVHFVYMGGDSGVGDMWAYRYQV